MKHIKHTLAILAVFALLVTPVSALNLGTWTLSGGDLVDGEFIEQLVGMSPFGPLVEMDIFAQPPSLQWSLLDLFLTSETFNPDGSKTSTYAGGTLFLDEQAGLWGESITVSGVDLMKEQVWLPNGGFAWVSTSVFYQDYVIMLSGSYLGIPGVNLDTDMQTYFHGWNFQEIVISVSEVPEPGTVALLGLGLLAVAVGRKKLFK